MVHEGATLLLNDKIENIGRARYHARFINHGILWNTFCMKKIS